MSAKSKSSNPSYEAYQEALELHLQFELLYYLRVAETELIFRPLTFRELLACNRDFPRGVLDNWIVSKAVLWSSRPLESLRLGIDQVLSPRIQEVSTLDPEHELEQPMEVELVKQLGLEACAVGGYDYEDFLDLPMKAQMTMIKLVRSLVGAKTSDRPKRTAPPVPRGYESMEVFNAPPMDKETLLSPESADKPDPDRERSMFENL